MTRFRLTRGERCCAILESGQTCGRLATRATGYHGDKELYGTFNEPWAGWVRVALCDAHSDDRQDRTRGEQLHGRIGQAPGPSPLTGE